MESSLSADLVTRTLNFHGQQLQKLWEGERGEGDLSKNGVNPKDLDFAIYQQRQKHLSFQDRGKRLKLQQFIVKKAAALFDSTLLETGELPEKVVGDEDYYAVLPPYETFLSLDKQRRVQLFYQRLKKGDIIIGSILLKSVMGSSMTLRVLCTDGENARCVSDLNIKAVCPTANTVPAVDKKGSRTYLINDTVCCEVLEVKADSEKIVVGMKGVTLPPNSEFASRLGLIHSDDFPEVYNMYKTMQSKTITEIQIKQLIASKVCFVGKQNHGTIPVNIVRRKKTTFGFRVSFSALQNSVISCYPAVLKTNKEMLLMMTL